MTDTIDNTRQQARKKAWEEMFIAGMNVRYHRMMISRLEKIDVSVKIIGFVLGSATVISALSSTQFFQSQLGVVLVAVAAACVAGAGFYVPFSQRKKDNGELMEDWVGLRGEWEHLYESVPILPLERFSDELGRLKKIRERLEGRQKQTPNQEFLKTAYRRECEFRGVDSMENHPKTSRDEVAAQA